MSDRKYIFILEREAGRNKRWRAGLARDRWRGEGRMSLSSFSISYCMHFICTVSPADFPQFSWLPIYPIMIMSVLGHLRPALLGVLCRQQPPDATRQPTVAVTIPIPICI